MPNMSPWERDKHAILGGKVHLYRRGTSENWHCSTFLKGRNRRKSTKEDSLSLARQIAEDWYLELRGKARVSSSSRRCCGALAPLQVGAAPAWSPLA